MILNEYFVLSNGVKIPKIGFGTWQINPGAYEAVTLALKNGYRHIDTAEAYGNESDCAKAIRDFGLKREDVFITTKLPSHVKNYDDAKIHFEQSLERMKLDYIDLYLIHAPWPWSDQYSDHKEGNIGVWKAFVEKYNEGKIKSIGVSNFGIKEVEYLYEATGVYPHVNQVPLCIGVAQTELRKHHSEKGILVEAYSPLATGKLLDVPKVVELATKYNVTPAQICIRFTLQLDTLPLPKSTNETRIINNAQLDFVIDDADMDTLLNDDSIFQTHLKTRVRND